MVSVCLPSDALLQHLLSYLGFSYLGHGVSLHGCASKVQLLLLTLDEGYLLTATSPDLECGVAPLGPPAPMQPLLLGRGVDFPFSRGSSQPRIEPRSPALQADSLFVEPHRKTKNTGVGSSEDGPKGTAAVPIRCEQLSSPLEVPSGF